MARKANSLTKYVKKMDIFGHPA
jgi:hypothetical protein